MEKISTNETSAVLKGKKIDLANLSDDDNEEKEQNKRYQSNDNQKRT